MNRGIISIGTNSTRALVAAVNGKARILLSRSIGTRIGEGLKEHGHLEPEPVRRTLEAVREHARAVRALTGDVRAIATSALRRADNGEWFAEQVREIAGAPLEIISGEEEARRSFTGAVCGLDAPAGTSFGVLDTGGGSSEYAVGTSAGPQRIVSCEIGAVRLTEAVPELAGDSGLVTQGALARARALAREAVAQLRDFPHAERLIYVGGTATTAISVRLGKREMFEYAALTHSEVRALIQQLCDVPLEERKALAGMNPQRADILPAGLLVLDAVFECTGHERALVSTNDLLLGTLLA